MDPIRTPGRAGARGEILFTKGAALFLDTPFVRKVEKQVPEPMVEAWSENFIEHIPTKWVDGWSDVLDSLGSFIEKLWTPAVAGYPAFVNPAFRNKRGQTGAQIVRLHNEHLGDAYERTRQGVQSMTVEPNPILESAVEQSRPAYKKGEPDSLTFTGSQYELTKECTVRHWYWLNSDPRLLANLRTLDVLGEGWPPETPFLVEGSKWEPARRFANILVQGGVFFVNGHEMSHTHALLDDFLTAWTRDVYADPPRSHVRFLYLDGVPTIRTLMAFPEEA